MLTGSNQKRYVVGSSNVELEHTDNSDYRRKGSD